MRLAGAFALPGVIERTRCPILVVGAGRDLVVPPEEAVRYCAAAGERGTLLWYPHGSHGLYEVLPAWTTEAARWLVLRAAWTVDQGEDPRHSSSMAKLYGAGMINRLVDRVMQIHGGMGYTRELPIERWYRQVRLLRIYEGTDEMQRLIISRDLLRGYTKIGGHLA